MLPPFYCLFLLLIFGGSMSASGQEGVPPEPEVTEASQRDPLDPITSIAELMTIPPNEADRLKLPVVLRGVLTGPNQVIPRALMQCGDSSVHILFSKMPEIPPLGMDIILYGLTAGRPLLNGPETCVEVRSYMKLGRDKLPEPRKLTVEEAARIPGNGFWAEVEGIVVQTGLTNGSLNVHLAGESGMFLAIIRGWGNYPLPANWHGARIKLPGAVFSENGSGRMFSFVGRSVTVLSPGRTDPFQAPAASAAELVNSRTGSGDRFRLGGVITCVEPGGLVYLRSPTAPLTISPMTPFDQALAGSRGDGLPVPVLRLGDKVELVGSPLVEAGALRMRYGQIRVLGNEGDPAPVAVANQDIAAGRYTSELVAVRGRLVNQLNSQVRPGFAFESVKLDSNGTLVEAFLGSEKGGELPVISGDHLISAVGVVVPALGNQPPRIRLRNAGDLRSLGIAPEVTRSKTLRYAGIIAAAAAAAALWIILLRRSLARQRTAAAAIRELNTGLEKRVTERTSQLEVAKEELSRALEQERELGELKSRFVSLVSHEFRTPLGVTMSAIELLRHYSDRLPQPKREELHEDIFRSTRHMASLMEQVLLLGRVEAGRMGFKPAPLDVPTLMHKLCDEALSATNRRSPVICRTDGEFGEAVGDEALLRHIFSNLISNAVKYSAEGSEVLCAAVRDGKHAVFSVQDHGIGIPEADRERLFQAFHRASNVGDIPGTGLGLVVVKRCVDMHGGTMSVRSVEGQGTTFIVRIPLFDSRTPAESVTLSRE